MLGGVRHVEAVKAADAQDVEDHRSDAPRPSIKSPPTPGVGVRLQDRPGAAGGGGVRCLDAGLEDETARIQEAHTVVMPKENPRSCRNRGR